MNPFLIQLERVNLESCHLSPHQMTAVFDSIIKSTDLKLREGIKIGNWN